jgi:uncharacterized membrane protein YcfT
MAPVEFVVLVACASDSEQSTRALDPQRVEWVDYSKGWCIILVVMMHSSIGVGLAIGETSRWFTDFSVHVR